MDPLYLFITLLTQLPLLTRLHTFSVILLSLFEHNHYDSSYQ
ncbi:hypothetical protein GAGA_1304 [Paraglaciecola agarilytica NO2]|uniref:Uncharacterized protein n=1 Tax=Paraglaciecola agarilytica NO2 TaxID=1125747 RepID=A0ABQ0I4A5_9ALTE|nr:hypothetical protein GAGA_1304 [Paraglaciecola agarilytica NO2]